MIGRLPVVSSLLPLDVDALVRVLREPKNALCRQYQELFSMENAKLESGDLIGPIESGVLDWLEVHELHAVVAGDVQGRASDEDIIVFKSNGLAAWDLAAAVRVVELARVAGVGSEL